MNNLIKQLWAWALTTPGRVAIGGALGYAGATIAGSDSWHTAGTAIGGAVVLFLAKRFIGGAK